MKSNLPILLALLLGAVFAGQTQTPSAAAPAVKSWLIRLIPPRSTFLADMTEKEKQLMEEHYLYWKDLNDKGVCVFGGPVLDPQGVYGVLAVRAATEDEARKLAEADPSVKGGVNRVEVFEMRIALWPKTQPQ